MHVTYLTKYLYFEIKKKTPAMLVKKTISSRKRQENDFPYREKFVIFLFR